jgi:hypothetical protein
MMTFDRFFSLMNFIKNSFNKLFGKSEEKTSAANSKASEGV